MVPMVPPIVIARKRLARRFLRADAVRAEDAIPFEPSNLFERRVFASWRDAGILRPGGVGSWYLDLAAYKEERHSKRKRGLILAGAAAVAGALFALTR